MDMKKDITNNSTIRPKISFMNFLTEEEEKLCDLYYESILKRVKKYTTILLKIHENEEKQLAGDLLETTSQYAELEELEKSIDELGEKTIKIRANAKARYIASLENNKEQIIADAKTLIEGLSAKELLTSTMDSMPVAYKLGIHKKGIASVLAFELSRRLNEQHEACKQYNYNDIEDILKSLEYKLASDIVENFTDEEKKLAGNLIDNYKGNAEPIIEELTEPATPLEKLVPIIKSKKFYMSNTLITNNLTNIFDKLLKEEPNGQISLLPAKVQLDISGNKKNEVFSNISFSYGGELSFNKQRIKEYDRLILDAVCTILYAGNGQMTDADIYRTLKGNTKTRPTQKQLSRIREGMLKMSGTRMYADVTEELKRGYLNTDNEELKRGVWDKAIVEYDGLELTAPNGTIQKVYSFRDNRGNIRYPMIMQYCQAKGQIVSYPITLLDTPEHYTEDYALIKSYLLKEITNLKNGHRHNNNVLLYRTMYEKCGIIEPTSKDDRKRDRIAIKKMFDYWIEQKYIKKYLDHKEGRAITGIEIYI